MCYVHLTFGCDHMLTVHETYLASSSPSAHPTKPTQPPPIKIQNPQEQMDLTYRDLNALLERSRGEERAYVSQLIRPMREQLDTAEVASRHVKRMLSQQRQQQRPQAH